MKKINIHKPGLRRGFGCIGALLQVGLTICDYGEEGLVSLDAVYAAIALLFLASAIFAILGPLQALLCYVLGAIETATSLNCFYGLGFVLLGAIVVFRQGWFLHRPAVKATILAALGCAILVFPIVTSPKPPIYHAAVCIAAAIYSIVVFVLAKGRTLSAFGPKKPIIKLADYGLTNREAQVVKARLRGKTVKEFALEVDLAPSTVRNVLATACHKLGLEDRESLGAMGEKYRVQ
jgi:DNA-binding CsgD family transcriptional regulator